MATEPIFATPRSIPRGRAPDPHAPGLRPLTWPDSAPQPTPPELRRNHCL